MNLWCFMTALLTFLFMIIGSYFTYGMSVILATILMLFGFAVCTVGLGSLGYWLIYHKTIKAFSFVGWMFRMKNVYAGWYNNKILLRVKHSNGIDDYSLQGFVGSIKNELEITDKSDRSKPVHIYVDVTSDNKTNVVIENVQMNG